MATQKAKSRPIGQALFEEDYVLRTLGRIGHDPETALTELVANAWDAGAFKVQVIVPTTRGVNLSIEDDGHGMTSEQFKARWMTLGYDRVKNQGARVAFPAERAGSQRRAFGRNGVGRHGLLCFADRYTVETWRDQRLSTFVVGTRNQPSPFFIEQESFGTRSGHGTRLMVEVQHHLPDPQHVRTILAARFLHDPEFVVSVNGQSVPLPEHEGLIEQSTLTITPERTVEAYVVDTTRTASSTRHQGVAFWVNNRLVGTPSWYIGFTSILDGRSRFAKRYAIVITGGDEWIAEVEPDWSRFKATDTTKLLVEGVAQYAKKMFDKLSADFVQESSEDALMQNREAFRVLPALAQTEVAHFTQTIVAEHPGIAPEVLSAAVKAVIHLEKSRSGASLLERLLKLDDQDIAGLDQLLSQWTIQDALSVLDEIDQRLSVIVAIEKLSGDTNADELHTLHPLVTQARWLFGPEFDSPEYASNVTLRTAATKVLKIDPQQSSFSNPLKRADLVMSADSTFSVVGTEAFDSQTQMVTSIRDVLIIELKKGRSTINREAMNQADGYIQDFVYCGLMDGKPTYHAFVVGHEVDSKTARGRDVICEGEARGHIQGVTYHQLARTANQRLLRLKDRIPARYEEMSGFELASKVMGTPSQAPLLPPIVPST